MLWESVKLAPQLMLKCYFKPSTFGQQYCTIQWINITLPISLSIILKQIKRKLVTSKNGY